MTKIKEMNDVDVSDLFWILLVPRSQALAGEVGMSSELDEVARALFNGQIPAIWKKLAPDTLKSLGNWMSHFKRRCEQYSDWVSLHPSDHRCSVWFGTLEQFRKQNLCPVGG